VRRLFSEVSLVLTTCSRTLVPNTSLFSIEKKFTDGADQL
jgi:hypothetical protein